MSTPEKLTPDQEIVQTYLDSHFRIVTWAPFPADQKGPREEGWQHRQYTLADFQDGYRVGILTGTEVQPGKYLVDVDIDYAPAASIVLKFLPPTDFVYGRKSKKISHCFFTTPEPVPSFKYQDVDKTCLVEIRGIKTNGVDIGFQSMAPPSVWSKDGIREPLTFVKKAMPGHVDSVGELKQAVTLGAIGALFAKHFGHNGFGHDTRLSWAGYLLRLTIPTDDIIKMGEAISAVCNNTEVKDVRQSVESTAQRLKDPKAKVVGGPSLIKILGGQGRAVLKLIADWLGRDSDFVRDKDGVVLKDHQDNIRRAIELCEVELSRNSFSEKLLYKKPDEEVQSINDHLIDELWFKIEREFRFRPTPLYFEKMVHSIAHNHTFHPVKDYLSKLQWDGVPRIDRWLSTYGGADEGEYFSAVGSLVLIAAVRRIRVPGCKFDEMLVLESPQGMNKSTALRSLCPKEEWFSDNLPLTAETKEVIEQTLGKWIIESSDLSGGRKADTDHLKSMLSRQVDGPVRMAYGRFPVERARQFIVIGTTNNSEYLKDATGARRFWPVKVKQFDVVGILRDRDQLWAEASAREAKGESIRLPERLWSVAEGHQEARRETDAWEEIIQEMIDNRAPSVDGRHRIPTSDIWEYLAIEGNRRGRLEQKRIVEIMTALGFTKANLKPDGIKSVRGWMNHKLTPINPLLKVEGEDGEM